MSLSVLLLVARLAAPAGPEPEGAPALPITGVEPLDGSGPAHQGDATGLPTDGIDPLEDMPAPGPPPTPALPLGRGPGPLPKPPPPDPATTNLVRIDATIGVFGRVRPVDPSLGTTVEFGRMQGFSAAFHTSMLVVTDRDFVRAFDFPIGAGAILRGKLRNKPLYGSVGVTAGILVHRAGREEGVIRRVDPDFRVPLRMVWSVGRLGASLALVTGYSVRDRIYTRRGSNVFERSAIRVGLELGLCWDIIVGRNLVRPRDRRGSRRH